MYKLLAILIISALSTTAYSSTSSKLLGKYSLKHQIVSYEKNKLNHTFLTCYQYIEVFEAYGQSSDEKIIGIEELDSEVVSYEFSNINDEILYDNKLQMKTSGTLINVNLDDQDNLDITHRIGNSNLKCKYFRNN